ncbi:HD domain-containing protein [Halobacillus shinanisalinarum]|uniref:HD domain-containing protein n=1 Tax=Halobacillus shinanisalinarum TaxID=2932258 RepID=A0ABY4H044_9BACI|nr:HD domain-containing protein [Halobacillus shinanisalinarum]UOQ93524.1 HD domain-containing protein [Halobacillus shinanisalinarum]
MDRLLAAIQGYVREYFDNDSTGHDYYHMKRVASWARFIAEQEGADPFICEVSGWLHDMGDAKLFANPEEAKKNVMCFLSEQGIDEASSNEIKMAMEDVSFSKGAVPKTLEGKIVQDADRLDAIGAIGIARTFAYGGAHGQLIHSEQSESATSIQHFHDKLLKISALIHTSSARKEAEKRHQFIVDYLKRFSNEWSL